jgi:hypothetical protein
VARVPEQLFPGRPHLVTRAPVFGRVVAWGQ